MLLGVCRRYTWEFACSGVRSPEQGVWGVMGPVKCFDECQAFHVNRSVNRY